MKPDFQAKSVLKFVTRVIGNVHTPLLFPPSVVCFDKRMHSREATIASVAALNVTYIRLSLPDRIDSVPLRDS